MSTGFKSKRMALFLLGGVTLLTLSGCSLAVLITRTVFNEPILVFDSIMLNAKMDRLAKKAWHEFKTENNHMDLSHNYKEGFIDGYVSYLDAGGNCVPPATPPRKYWRYTFLSQKGFSRIKDYMEGYQEGSLQAKASNQRDILQVPVLIGDDLYNYPKSSLKPNHPGSTNQNSTQPNPTQNNSPGEMPDNLPTPRPGIGSNIPITQKNDLISNDKNKILITSSKGGNQ